MDRSSWGFAGLEPKLARFGAQTDETGCRVRSLRPSPALLRRPSAPLPPAVGRRRRGARRPGLVGSKGDPEGCAARRGTRWPRKGSRGRTRRSSGAGPLRATLLSRPGSGVQRENLPHLLREGPSTGCVSLGGSRRSRACKSGVERLDCVPAEALGSYSQGSSAAACWPATRPVATASLMLPPPLYM